MNLREHSRQCSTVIETLASLCIAGAHVLIWRLLNTTPRAEVQIFDNLISQPSTTILELVRTIFKDIYESDYSSLGNNNFISQRKWLETIGRVVYLASCLLLWY